MDSDTKAAREIIVADLAAGRNEEYGPWILNHIDCGEMRAELLPEADVDEERAADTTPYGQHVGDFLFHFIH